MAVVAPAGSTWAVELHTPRHDYLRVVQDYADAMLTHGHDVYGAERSPLFAEALDRTTMRMLETDERATISPSIVPGARISP